MNGTIMMFVIQNKPSDKISYKRDSQSLISTTTISNKSDEKKRLDMALGKKNNVWRIATNLQCL